MAIEGAEIVKAAGYIGAGLAMGLGAIGPLAGKPVMEGKGVLFKIFADVDVYDLNIATMDPEKVEPGLLEIASSDDTLSSASAIFAERSITTTFGRSWRWPIPTGKTAILQKI